MGQQISKAVKNLVVRVPQHLNKPLRSDPTNTAGFDRDAVQQQFLRQKGGPVEMPPDLVQFLKDVGPVKKLGDEKESSTQSQQNAPAGATWTSRRTRQMMPLASAVDGFDTERTTNFSYLESAKEDGTDILGLYQFVIARNHPDEQVDQYADTAEGESVLQLFRDSRMYLDIPVICKDSDDGFIGVHPEKLGSLRMQPTPKTVVKLVLEDLIDNQGTK